MNLGGAFALGGKGGTLYFLEIVYHPKKDHNYSCRLCCNHIIVGLSFIARNICLGI